jgi:hypothetical protein
MFISYISFLFPFTLKRHSMRTYSSAHPLLSLSTQFSCFFCSFGVATSGLPRGGTPTGNPEGGPSIKEEITLLLTIQLSQPPLSVLLKYIEMLILIRHKLSKTPAEEAVYTIS